MSKRDRKTIASLVSSIFLIPIGYFVWFKLEYINVYTLFGIPLISSVLWGITFSLLSNKKKSFNKNASKPFNESTSRTTIKKQLSEKELLTADINSLSGDDFERLCFMYFKDKGYNPKMTSVSGDHGVDLVIKDPKDGLQIAVQCKRHKETIGNGELLKLEAGKRFYKCPKTLFITTSNYTYKAKEYAEQIKMDIWNGLIVEDKIGRWKKKKLKNNG